MDNDSIRSYFEGAFKTSGVKYINTTGSFELKIAENGLTDIRFKKWRHFFEVKSEETSPVIPVEGNVQGRAQLKLASEQNERLCMQKRSYAYTMNFVATFPNGTRYPFDFGADTFPPPSPSAKIKYTCTSTELTFEFIDLPDQNPGRVKYNYRFLKN